MLMSSGDRMRTPQPLYPKLRRQQDETAPQERAERHLAGTACILIVDGVEEEAKLEDYTARGFRVSCRKRPLVGTSVQIALPGCHAVDAVVRWALGNSASCLFQVPVNAELIRRAVDGAALPGAQLMKPGILLEAWRVELRSTYDRPLFGGWCSR
jgi:hypothetical protein